VMQVQLVAMLSGKRQNGNTDESQKKKNVIQKVVREKCNYFQE
jgi:hypothetical protein